MALGVRLAWNYGLLLLLSIPVAGLLVRLFILQHDCGHGSFFKSQGLNDAVGRAIGVVDADAICLLAIHPRHSPCVVRSWTVPGIGGIVTLSVKRV